jgi:hypothetical protein
MSTINGGTLLTQAGTMASFTNRNKQLAVLATILAQANAGTPVGSNDTQETILSNEVGLDQLSSQQLLGIVINQFQNLFDGSIPVPDTFNAPVTFNAGITVNGTSALNGTVTVTGNETVSGTLGVTGATTFSSTVSTGKLTIIDNTAAAPANVVLHSPNAIGADLAIANGYGSQPSATYPIGNVRPAANVNGNSGTRVAFDIMPNTTGAPSNTLADAWIDICSFDFANPNGTQQEFLRVGWQSSAGVYGLLGCNAFGTGTVRPLAVQPYGGNLVIGGTSNISGYQVDSNPQASGNNGGAFGSFGGSVSVAARVAAGTSGSPTAATTSQVGDFRYQPYDGSAYNTAARLKFTPTNTHSGSNRGTWAAIETTKDGTTSRGSTAAFYYTGVQISDTGAAASPTAGCVLEAVSTAGGVRFPNMTTTQKNALPNVAGNCVFDTTLGKLCINTGSAWQTITSA